jgi:parvulin-like peptidyl-prolyl isomerase
MKRHDESMKSRILSCSISLACFSLAVSCRQVESPGPARVEDPNAVAVVAGTVISAEAFRGELQRQFRHVTEKDLTTQQKLAALETLVRNESVYAKAKTGGFDQRPEIQARIKSLIIGQFKEQQSRLKSAPVTEQEIEASYRANGNRYAQPETIRAALIFMSVPETATEERKAELREQAEAVSREARTADERAFAQLAVHHSEDQASRYRGGDIGWLTRGAAQVEPSVTEALFLLRQPDEFAPLIQTARGFYIAKLLEKREAARRPLAEVREAIRYQLSRQKAEQAELDFYAAMKAGLEIQINQDLIESISLPVKGNEVPPAPAVQTVQINE